MQILPQTFSQIIFPQIFSPKNKELIKKTAIKVIVVIAICIITYIGFSYFGLLPESTKVFHLLIGLQKMPMKITGLKEDKIVENFYFFREGFRLCLSSYWKLKLAHPIFKSIKNRPKSLEEKVLMALAIVISLLFLDTIISSLWRIRTFYRLAYTNINSQGENENNLPVALVVRAVSDYNNAFSLNNNLNFFSQLESKFYFRTKKVSNLLDVNNAIDAFSKTCGKIKLLVFSAHGSPTSLLLSNTLDGILKPYSTAPEWLFDGVAEDGVVVLDSCKTGGFSYLGTNMVDFFARKIKGREVIGPVKKTLELALQIKSLSPLKVIFKEMGSLSFENNLFMFGLDRLIPILSSDITYRKIFMEY